MQQKAVLSESTLLKEFRMGGSITAMGIMETSKFLLAVVYGAIFGYVSVSPKLPPTI